MGHTHNNGQLRGARDSRGSLEATIDRAEFVEQRKGSDGTIYVIRRLPVGPDEYCRYKTMKKPRRCKITVPLSYLSDD